MKAFLDANEARSEHQRAVQEFLVTARAVSPAQWEHAIDAVTWSPAQIAEHVRMTYEVVDAQFAGSGTGLRVRTSRWQRLMLRWRFLGGILRTGVFPAGARAPREVRPGAGPFDQAVVLKALERAAESVDTGLTARWTDPDCVMTHHVFGGLRPPEALRLLTVHTRHHAAQLSARASAVS